MVGCCYYKNRAYDEAPRQDSRGMAPHPRVSGLDMPSPLQRWRHEGRSRPTCVGPTCNRLSAIATKDDNNEARLTGSVYLPFSGRGTSVFLQATSEIEAIIMQTPAYDTVLAGGFIAGFGKESADGEARGEWLIARETNLGTRPAMVR